MRKTLNVRRLSSAAVTDLVNGWLFAPETITNGEVVEYPKDAQRPRTRAECEDGERPCPFVSCRHHLYLDVNPRTGAIKLNFPRLEVWEMPETCSLDVADRYEHKGAPLPVLAAAMGLSYDRGYQVVDEAKRRAAQVVHEMSGEDDAD